MTKVTEVSEDGNTWYGIPGPSSGFKTSASTIDDTILGQSFRSSDRGATNWSITSAAFYKGNPGYQGKVLKGGTPTSALGLATASPSSHWHYVTDLTKSAWDVNNAIVVNDNGSPISASNVLLIDYLHGGVRLIDAYTPTGAITIDAYYLPLTEIANYKGYELKIQADAIDISDMETVRTTHYMAYSPGLRNGDMSLDGIYAAENGWITYLTNNTLLVLEINPDGNRKSWARGFYRVTEQEQSGAVGALEEEKVTLPLYVPPTPKLYSPLSWRHANDTQLPQGLRVLLDSWQNQTLVHVRYLSDGVNGQKGQGVVTDLSLSAALDQNNEFAVNIQGTAGLTAVP